MIVELIKRLRELQAITEHCGEQLCFECENRDLCDKHDNKTLSGTYKEAADAIEELSKKRVGTWHRFKATQRSYSFVCNSCGSICLYLTRFCPNCGVEYIGEEPPEEE